MGFPEQSNLCVYIHPGAEAAAKKWRGLIGASLSEPHTSESNGGFFIIIIWDSLSSPSLKRLRHLIEYS